MGNVMVKRVNAAYSKEEDIFRVMRYMCSEKDCGERLSYWNTRGLPKDLEKAASRLEQSQAYLGKDSGRRINHLIVSFPETVQDEKIVYIAAERLADLLGEEYALLYGVHQDTDHLHIHFAMNTVSYRTGKKFHANRKEFQAWKEEIAMCAEGILEEWGCK